AFVIDRSAAAAATVVVADAVLLAAFGSVWSPDSVAVFVVVPAVVGAVTTIVRVADAPLARMPIVHVTLPEPFVQPVEAVTNVTPVGRLSVMVTPVALPGPPSLTDTVQVNCCPVVTVAGAVFVIARSAVAAWTCVVAVAVLLAVVGSVG